jgi:hypothetical protein
MCERLIPLSASPLLPYARWGGPCVDVTRPAIQRSLSLTLL